MDGGFSQLRTHVSCEDSPNSQNATLLVQQTNKREKRWDT